MLGACRKETYSSKLVLKDVVSGLPKVGRIPPGVPKQAPVFRPVFVLNLPVALGLSKEDQISL